MSSRRAERSAIRASSALGIWAGGSGISTAGVGTSGGPSAAGRIQRDHAERDGLVLTVALLRRLAIVLSRDQGPNGRVRETGVGHSAQAGADAVLGLQKAAVLLCKGVCDRAGGREAELDEDLAQRLAGPILLRERLRQLVGGEDSLVDHELAELASVVVGRFHRSPIGLEGPRLKG